jgi:hypothetical protein
MKYTEFQAMEIAKQYKKKYPSLTNEISSAKFQPTIHNDGYDIWIVTGKYELFGDINEFFYIISDETGLVEYTFNEHGTRNPHLWGK